MKQAMSKDLQIRTGQVEKNSAGSLESLGLDRPEVLLGSQVDAAAAHRC
jgi:hypothetical protein